MDKKVKKLIEGKCYFCDIDDYSLLDVHRIMEGAKGGKYSDYNTVVCCTLCHRKIHSRKITIHGKYFSTAGRYVLHYTDEEGKEVWK